MSSPPGRRAAPKSSRPEGQEPTRQTPRGGRRASEPTTGTLPIIDAPLLGDEPTTGGGRRIKPVAPVSQAPEQGDRLVVRSFDHTGEIPAVQVLLPEPLPAAEPGNAAEDTGSVDLPPAWEPLAHEVPSTPEVPDVDTLFAAAEVFAEETPRPRGRRVRDVPVDSISMPALTPELMAEYEASLRAAAAAKVADLAPAGKPEPSESTHVDGVTGPAASDMPDTSEASDESEHEVEARRRLSRRERRRLLREQAAGESDESASDEPAQHSLAQALAEEVHEATGEETVTVGVAEPLGTPLANAADDSSDDEGAAARRSSALTRLSFWSGVLLLGVVLLSLAALHVGPSWLDGAGAVAVLTTYCWAAAARTGGRQIVFASLGLAIGVSALLVDGSVLRSGAAVMTCVTSGVLAVVLTVPAKNFLIAVREVAIATAVASIGAFATIGFEPVASTSRFELLTLIIGVAVMVALVWRFAAGLHGLGTRGLVIVVVGTVLLCASQVYAEVLRNYGEPGLMGPTSDLGTWLRDTIGAAPRMIMVLLGVPALVWGVHMRARRRQGWWVCTFGAAATLPVAQRLVNLETSYVEAGLQTFYSVALGCLVGWALIAADKKLTGQRGTRAAGGGDADGLRPEPSRFSSL